MARFSFEFNDPSGGSFSGSDKLSSGLSSEDILAILRPAAEVLRDHYRATILRFFKRRTGSLADSITISEFGLDREYMDSSEASLTVGPTGKHKGSKRAARSRKGSTDRKYAKHNRTARATNISNAELAYLLEYGTPRIAPTHWMETANEEIEEEIGQIIEAEWDNYLKSKGF